jgi:L-amino acid N-acyltransferase YncA
MWATVSSDIARACASAGASSMPRRAATARALVEEGHRRGLRRIVANMAASNVASARVAEKLGMRLEARFRNPRNRNLETLLYVSER